MFFLGVFGVSWDVCLVFFECFLFFWGVFLFFLGVCLGFLLLVTWDDLVCLFVVCFARVLPGLKAGLLLVLSSGFLHGVLLFFCLVSFCFLLGFAFLAIFILGLTKVPFWDLFYFVFLLVGFWKANYRMFLFFTTWNFSGFPKSKIHNTCGVFFHIFV